VHAARIETGADVGEVQGCSEKSLLHVAAVGRKVAADVAFLEANGLESLTLVDESGGKDFAVTQEFAVAVEAS
jgi:hypothetical protein